MNPSPLLLERHFFSKIALDAHLDPPLDRDNVLRCQMEVAQAADNPRRFQVVLKLGLESRLEKRSAYTGEIHAVGFFRVVDDYPDDKIPTLVQTNGSALLYGAIRELVINLTSRGPWPPIVLKSVTFLPVEEKQPAAPKQTVKARIRLKPK
jgi:preprotein translocase subunit SecB